MLLSERVHATDGVSERREARTRPFFSPHMGGTIRLSYQAEGEQPRRCESVGHEDEAQSPDRDGGPEYAVQAAGSLVTHQQRRGHGVGVDEAGVGAL